MQITHYVITDYVIYKTTKQCMQLNDVCTDVHKPISDTLIQTK
jgi:hypothetical protein